ncbi:hypothetical protein [Pararhizobium sp. DWP1-1-3]|uniref:hypothetical protein n=1 Tax=Pararhizobium sp. DWP1-1-3 TaxID=2804652 RepID=UPI003CF9D1B6
MKFIFAVAVSCTLAGTAFAATAPSPMKKLSVVTNQAGFEVAYGAARQNAFGTSKGKDGGPGSGKSPHWG